MASAIPRHHCSILQRGSEADSKWRRSSQRAAASSAGSRAVLAQRRPPAAAALARRRHLAPARALTRPEDELDSDEDEDWELEAEEDLDEGDFMDLEGVTISMQEQG